MSTIELQGVEKYFASQRVVGPLSLRIEEGEFVSLLGPSGCGKTTTLRIIAGFETATRGSVLIGNRCVDDVPIERRGIGMVFQHHALFPHMTAAENVGFGLRLRAVPRPERRRRIAELLDVVGLTGLDARRPRELSGGQQQRVSLARALATQPQVLLLDEPLSSLDLKLREQLRTEIRRLQKSLGITAIGVTHDQGEALAMSDRVAVMQAGTIAQIGTPPEIYRRPASLEVARFIGQCSTIPGEVTAPDAFQTERGLVVPLLMAGRRVGGGQALVIRPEAVSLSGARDPANSFPAVVEEATYLGEGITMQLRLVSGDKLLALERPTPLALGLRPGDAVHASVCLDDCIVIDEAAASHG